MAASNPEIVLEQRTAPGRTAAHVDALTGYRGLAALVVLVVHGAGHTAYPEAALDGYGPIALFVLSGYLLVAPWSKWSLGLAGPPDLRSFTKQRLARIFPAYLLVLGVVALIYPASRPQGDGGWLRALTLTNFLSPDGLRPAMEHIWTMGVEISWYAVLPVVGTVLALLGRRLWPGSAVLPVLVVLLAGCLITVAWHLWMRGHTSLSDQLTYPMWLPAYLVCFLLGATVRHLEIAAPATRAGGAIWARLQRATVLVGAVALVSLGVLLSDLSGPVGWATSITWSERRTRDLAATILALALLLLVVASRRGLTARALSWPPLVDIGRWSYGVYLWHLPVTIILAEHMTILPGPFGFVLWIAVLLAVSTVLAAATYRFLETPAIAWSKRAPRG